ncbi:MAG: hypothetical protein L0216_08550 [Planctomycetales bacterium]|nr:hypothetical protein [Planctomycetales bacterium]
MRSLTRFGSFVALSAAAVLGGGCTEDTKQFITNNTSGTVLPGNFPGAPVPTHNKAGDGMGFSEAGEFASGNLRYFPSGVGNRGIVLYTTSDGSNTTLWAHYFDGSSFTPPVSFRGSNINRIPPGSDPFYLSEAAVVFVNTPLGFRDGDAIVVFRWMDLDDFNASTSAGPNVRLHASYFDLSQSGAAVSSSDPDVRYGFDTTPMVLDQSDDTAINVTCFAPFSDGLHGGGIFLGDAFTVIPLNINFYFQGDVTNTLGVGFVQGLNAGSTIARPWYRTFDLSASNTTNVFGGVQSLPVDGTMITGTDPVFDYLGVYDGSLFYVYTDVSAGDGNLVWTVYGSSAATTSFTSPAATVNPTDGNANSTSMLGLGTLAGPDEGLTNLMGVLECRGLTAAANTDIYAVQFFPATGTFSASNDRVEIDGSIGAVGGQPAVQNTLSVVLNRTGEWALASWIQARSTTAAGNGLWCRGLQTTRTGTAPAINTRITGSSTGPGHQVDSITTGGATSTDQVQRLKFQEDVGYRASGVQSDRYSVHVLWQQDESSGPTLDRVRTRKVTFAPSTGASNPSAPTFGTEDALPDFLNTELNNGGTVASPGGWPEITGTDGGGAGGTAGDLITYYVRNITPVASSNPASYRAFQRRAGTSREIGSLIGGSGSAKECFGLEVTTTPTNPDILFSPNWAGTTQHLFFGEVRDDNPLTAGNNITANRHRFYNKDSTDGTIENRFTPVVSSTIPPVLVDRDVSQSSAWAPLATQAGSVVGLYQYQGGHFWYNQFDPLTGLWMRSGGASDPQLVDHESDTVLGGFGIGFPFPVNDPTLTLNKFMIFWVKSPGGTYSRWFVRVRD